MTTTSMLSSSSSSMALVDKQERLESDLELRLLQAFASYASERVAASYASLKHSSRVLGFLARTTEHVMTKTGLVALVGFLFAQYQRLGHPLVDYVDGAMGRRIIDAFVGILLLAQQHHGSVQDALLLLENGYDNQAEVTLKLTYEERLQALLQGEVPRLKTMVLELQQREAEAQRRADTAPPVMVMDLQDFVPKEEVSRLQEQSREALSEKEAEVVLLKAQLLEVERARQQLEQDLTDVHNYQVTERGRRFQEMEVTL